MYEQIIDVNKELCVICLEYIDSNDKYEESVCNKCILPVHKECINKWYDKKQKKICPICLDYEEVDDDNNNNYYNFILFNLFRYLVFTVLIMFVYLMLNK